MVRNAIAGTGGDLEDELISTGQAHPIGRIGQADDVANMVLFLASDKASFVTGSYFNVDGGLMAMGAWASTVGAAGSE
jgi:NAD(P)-dependent dehydrogenase (short-subunit alcohol dehydrogenase family)